MEMRQVSAVAVAVVVAAPDSGIEDWVEVDGLLLEHFVETVTETVEWLAPSLYTTPDSGACKAAPSRHCQRHLQESPLRLNQQYLKPTKTCTYMEHEWMYKGRKVEESFIISSPKKESIGLVLVL
jgi:hypothetical protein